MPQRERRIALRWVRTVSPPLEERVSSEMDGVGGGGGGGAPFFFLDPFLPPLFLVDPVGVGLEMSSSTWWGGARVRINVRRGSDWRRALLAVTFTVAAFVTIVILTN